MAWTNPVDPVASTVITVAYAVANFLTQIRWLRILTGGADPGGTGYMVTSDSTSTTSWKNGITAIAHVLGYTPVNKAGDSMSANLQMSVDNVGVQFFGGSIIRDIASFGGLLITADNGVFKVFTESAASEIFAADFSLAAPTFKTQVMWHDGNTTNRVTTAKIADDAVTADKGGVPLGAVVWFETLAELTTAGANWQRYTAADGLLLVGAGASYSGQTFVEATSYGSNWTPAIGVSVTDTIGVSDTIGVNNGTLAASSTGILGTASASTNVTAGGVTVASIIHTHPAPTITLSGAVAKSGSASKTGSAAIAGTSTVWLPPMRAGIHGRRI